MTVPTPRGSVGTGTEPLPLQGAAATCGVSGGRPQHVVSAHPCIGVLRALLYPQMTVHTTTRCATAHDRTDAAELLTAHGANLSSCAGDGLHPSLKGPRHDKRRTAYKPSLTCPWQDKRRAERPPPHELLGRALGGERPSSCTVIARMSTFRMFPVTVIGNSSLKTMYFGTLKWAIRSLRYRRIRCSASSRASAVAGAPPRQATQAQTCSPRRSSGTPITEALEMSGCAISGSSTSFG
mmetsp:Transcript_67459/g.195366  ORF Transcript_67459/g.195366 Transcript_67459/m.195366 type:complete len:238 (-) Transcript_67459:510-1223(-)